MPTYIGSNAPPTSFRNGGSCSACNRADRLVDIGVFVDYEGWVLLCAPCLSDAALCIKGMDLQGAHEPLATLLPPAALEDEYPGIIPPDSFPASEPMEEEPEYPVIKPPVDPEDPEEAPEEPEETQPSARIAEEKPMSTRKTRKPAAKKKKAPKPVRLVHVGPLTDDQVAMVAAAL